MEFQFGNSNNTGNAGAAQDAFPVYVIDAGQADVPESKESNHESKVEILLAEIRDRVGGSGREGDSNKVSPQEPDDTSFDSFGKSAFPETNKWFNAIKTESQIFVSTFFGDAAWANLNTVVSGIAGGVKAFGAIIKTTWTATKEIFKTLFNPDFWKGILGGLLDGIKSTLGFVLNNLGVLLLGAVAFGFARVFNKFSDMSNREQYLKSRGAKEKDGVWDISRLSGHADYSIMKEMIDDKGKLKTAWESGFTNSIYVAFSNFSDKYGKSVASMVLGWFKEAFGLDTFGATLVGGATAITGALVAANALFTLLVKPAMTLAIEGVSTALTAIPGAALVAKASLVGLVGYLSWELGSNIGKKIAKTVDKAGKSLGNSLYGKSDAIPIHSLTSFYNSQGGKISHDDAVVMANTIRRLKEKGMGNRYDLRELANSILPTLDEAVSKNEQSGGRLLRLSPSAEIHKLQYSNHNTPSQIEFNAVALKKILEEVKASASDFHKDNMEYKRAEDTVRALSRVVDATDGSKHALVDAINSMAATIVSAIKENYDIGSTAR